ncbi:hypothetical protein BOO69_09785 [Sulfitobacter alexandrii]|uniref:Uncharacterized protein n=1 Tax=Sulfitobacter alexandrii TaxID=1917485 RepID=A0A1J0WH84_9RHOB|nr:hypothetical protein [Sulfitobacter alexandrii]APE43673.1 hypothetical protein BOO69_09785 [Sulfitobacter alexandrii]
MIGLVLWSDAVSRKAVFWCEDQRDLVFYQGDSTFVDGAAFMEAGDMVLFSIDAAGRSRRARDVTVLERQACTELPSLLRDSPQRTAPPREEERKILSFRRGARPAIAEEGLGFRRKV